MVRTATRQRQDRLRRMFPQMGAKRPVQAIVERQLTRHSV
jgi:hypothetical protein